MLTLALYVLVAGFVAGVCVYRFALLLATEQGPFDMFTRLRATFGISHVLNAQGEPMIMVTQEHQGLRGHFQLLIGNLLACPNCSGGWLSLFAALGLVPYVPFWNWLIWVLVAWGYIWGIQYAFVLKLSEDDFQ